MGLIKQAFFHDNAYHKINSFQYHKDKEILRIGVDVYPTAAKEEVIGSTEYQIVEKNVIDNSRLDAEKAIDIKAIKKLAEDKILKVEADMNDGIKPDEERRELTQQEKDKIYAEIKDFVITEKMKVIGKGKMESLFEDIEKKAFPILYEALKKYSKKDELKDSKNS